MASFEHGRLNLYENGNWTTFHTLLDKELPVKTQSAYVLIGYSMIKDPENHLKIIKNPTKTNIQLAASLLTDLQKEFIGKLGNALTKTKKLPEKKSA